MVAMATLMVCLSPCMTASQKPNLAARRNPWQGHLGITAVAHAALSLLYWLRPPSYTSASLSCSCMRHLRHHTLTFCFFFCLGPSLLHVAWVESSVVIHIALLVHLTSPPLFFAHFSRPSLLPVTPYIHLLAGPRPAARCSRCHPRHSRPQLMPDSVRHWRQQQQQTPQHRPWGPYQPQQQQQLRRAAAVKQGEGTRCPKHGRALQQVRVCCIVIQDSSVDQ